MMFALLCLRHREKAILETVIRKEEGLGWSHVEILCLTNKKSYGAVFPRSREISFDKLLEKYEVRDFIPLNTQVSDSEAMFILGSLMGKWYSPLQLLVIYLKAHLSRWFSTVKLNLQDKLICTELAAAFMQRACGYSTGQSIETLGLKECVAMAKNADIDSQKIKVEN